MTRKPIEEDARFQAAVEERGFGFVMKDMHDCPYCIGLAGEAIFEVFREGEEHYKRQQAELAKLKH